MLREFHCCGWQELTCSSYLEKAQQHSCLFLWAPFQTLPARVIRTNTTLTACQSSEQRNAPSVQAKHLHQDQPTRHPLDFGVFQGGTQPTRHPLDIRVFWGGTQPTRHPLDFGVLWGGTQPKDTPWISVCFGERHLKLRSKLPLSVAFKMALAVNFVLFFFSPKFAYMINKQ